MKKSRSRAEVVISARHVKINKLMEYRIGCSGYHYDAWKNKFYPEGLEKEKWFDYYTEHFDTVEINNSFYKLPEKKNFETWYKNSPDKFLFTLKGSRYVTHMKKLKNIEDPVQEFQKRASLLKEKLGCILWQLPGNQHMDLKKLEKFGEVLSNEFTHVIEFRHETWFHPEVYDLMNDKKLTFCILSAPNGLPAKVVSTSDTGYMRFHGKTDWYRYDYSEKELHDWYMRLSHLNVKKLFIYFNNDYMAHAPGNALTMKKMIE